MTQHDPRLLELVEKDPRYGCEAYEFVYAAVSYTAQKLGRAAPDDAPAGASRASEPEPDHHISGPELLHGIRELAAREYGLLARTVFKMWGINSTADFGQIVFNLVEAHLMSKTDNDSPEDFRDVFDLDQALVHDYRIRLDGAD